VQKKDLQLSAAATILVALFLIPTLINTGLWGKLPFSPLLLFLIIPVLGVSGLFVASLIGKKIPLLWQFGKFAAVGFLNTAIDFGILNFLIAVTGISKGVGIIPMNAASFSIALVNSYFWNKEWVFPGRKQANFAIFVAVTLIGLAINSGIVYVLTTYVSPVFVQSDKLWANLAKVLATAVSLFWNFAGYKLVVFKK